MGMAGRNPVCQNLSAGCCKSLPCFSSPTRFPMVKSRGFSCSPHGVRPKRVFLRSNPQCGGQELNVCPMLSFSNGGTRGSGETHAWYSSCLQEEQLDQNVAPPLTLLMQFVLVLPVRGGGGGGPSASPLCSKVLSVVCCA